MRTVSVLALLSLALLLPVGSGAFARELCEQRTAETFVIDGEIDSAMLECVRERLEATTRQLVIESSGGSPHEGMEIAELLKRPVLQIVLRKECNSACANYILPMATELVVLPRTVILLHGGIDESLVRNTRARREELIVQFMREGGIDRASAEALYEVRLLEGEDMIERQKRFAERHRISPGWLLYRTAAQPSEISDLEGEFGAAGTEGSRFILAEEALVASCLPNVRVHPFQTQLEKDWFGSKWPRLRRRGVVRSAFARCVGRFGMWD